MATNNQINYPLAGQTGTGQFVGSTSPTLITPTLGAASATSLTLPGSSTLSLYLGATTVTPTFTFATVGDLSVSYSIQTCRYWQIGAMVLVSLTLRFTPTYTTSSGTARFVAATPTGASSFNWVLPVREVSSIIYTGTQLVATAVNGYFLINGQGSGVLAAPLTTANIPTGVQQTVVITGMYGI